MAGGLSCGSSRELGEERACCKSTGSLVLAAALQSWAGVGVNALMGCKPPSQLVAPLFLQLLSLLPSCLPLPILESRHRGTSHRS